MTNREKILLFLVLVAGAYGAYTFLLPSPRGKARHVERLELKALEQTAGAIRTQVLAYRLPETQACILARAESEWGTDPFFKDKLPSEIAAEKVQGDADARARAAAANRPANDPERKRLEERLAWEKDIVGKFAYTGFATMGEERLAVINGSEYRVGEEPPPGGCTIAKIEADKVVLKRRSGEGTVTLKVKE